MHTVASREAESSSTRQPRRHQRWSLKWQRTYEENQSMTWLHTDMDDKDRSVVSMLWCVVSQEYETRMCGSKSLSRAWNKSSINHKNSNIVYHADSEPHKTAMIYFCRDQAKSRNKVITSYSPIARSLLSPIQMGPDVREQVKRKIDIRCVHAKEHIAFLNTQQFMS